MGNICDMDSTTNPMQLTKPITFNPDFIGFTFEGNKITHVVPNGQASKCGVCVGWEIFSVNGKKELPGQTAIQQAIFMTHQNRKPTRIVFRKHSEMTMMTEEKEIMRKARIDEKKKNTGENNQVKIFNGRQNEKKKVAF